MEVLKAYLEPEGNKESIRKRYRKLADSVIEYVRKGMVAEANYLLGIDEEMGYSDLNRLYVGSLSGNLPKQIVRISVTKQSKFHQMLSPLHCACINPNLDILKSLMKMCPIFSLPDKNRRNLVHYAAANHNSDILRFLLKNGCEANELDTWRKTPLMIAA